MEKYQPPLPKNDRCKEIVSGPTVQSNAPTKKIEIRFITHRALSPEQGEYFYFLKFHAKRHLTGGDQIEVPKDPQFFGYETTLRLGGHDEIKELINHEWLSQTTVSVYIR